MSFIPPARRPLHETLEARILHSADLSPLLGADTAAAEVQWLAPASPAAAQRSEMIFVDASLPDAGTLIADLQAQRAGGRPIEIVVIEADADGLAVIGETLAGRSDLSAVHVLSHGSDGALQLGSTRLDAQTLLQRAGEIAAWSDALTENADLLLYGCDLAQTGLGRALIADLSQLTGADVAASTDLTGAAALGGNWRLEYQLGRIEASVAPSAWAQSRWQGVLATYTVNTITDVVGASLLPGSLRWAISQANANAGADTIVFAVDGTFNMTALSSGGDNNITGDFDITDSVSIVGNGTGNTVINGNGNDRVFDLRGGTITISGLTIQGGRSNEGAGVRIEPGANVILDNVVIQDNKGSGGTTGGGVYVDGGLTLLNSIVQRNGDNLLGSNTDGGGIYVDNGATLVARNSEIRDNVAKDKDGGGIYNKGAALTLERVTLAGNQAKRGGGLFADGSGSDFLLTNVTISGNTASDEGGGIWADRRVILNHVTVASNAALPGKGGGVYDTADDESANVRTQNSIFALNSGGNSYGTLKSFGYNLSDSWISGLNAVGDQRNTAAGLAALAANGGFTRTHAITAGGASVDRANPASTVSSDQRGILRFGGRADIGAYEYNPFGFAPTVSAVGDKTIDEDTTLAPVAFTVGDFETPPGSLIVTATSSNTALVPNANIVLGGSGANRTISLTPALHANSVNSGGPTTITISVSDGGTVTTTTFTVTVNPVNDAPVLNLPTPRTVDEGTALVLTGVDAPSIVDVDAGGSPVQLTLTASAGRLSLSQISGLSFVTGTGTDNSTMTFTGSLTAINAALDGLRFQPTAGYTGPAQIQFLVNDLGNSGGAAEIANGQVDITVGAVNDAPTLDVPGDQVSPALTPLVFSSGNGNAIVVADPDAGAASIRVSLLAINGLITLSQTTGLVFLVGGGSNDAAMTFLGSQADINAAFEGLSFVPLLPGVAQLDLNVNDLGNTGSGGPKQADASVKITVAIDAPPVLLQTPVSIDYTENDAPVLVAPGLLVIDVDSPTLASAKLRIGAGYAGIQDQLLFTPGAGMGNIVGSYSGGVLTLSSAGQTATLAEWQTALRSVAYLNTSESPSTAARTLIMTVNDGIADSPARQITLNVFAVNDAPVLSGANDLAPIAEDLMTSPGTLVSVLLAGHLSDVDADALAGIAVTAVDNTNGTWQYTIDGGSSWNDFGNVGVSAARLLAADALTSVRFVPKADWNGSVPSGLSFHAWDRSDAAAPGSVANVSVNGGSTAFSAALASAGITVQSVNDAPTVSAPLPDQVIDQGQAFNYSVSTTAFADIDHAVLSYSATLANGSALPSWLNFDAATQTFSGTPANADVGTITVRVTATDGSGASVADDFVLTVLNINDAPTLLLPVAAQSANQDAAFSFSVPAGSFGDIDVGDVLSYSARLSSGAALPTWLRFDAATQTFSGTPANGDVGALSLRIIVTDLAGASAQADFGLVVIDLNDAPLLARALGDQQAWQDTAFRHAVPAGSFGDIDVGDVLSYSARLSSGAALPVWLSFDAATQTFSGTPGVADLGRLDVVVIATDNAGATVQGRFAVLVSPPEPEPVFEPAEPTAPPPVTPPANEVPVAAAPTPVSSSSPIGVDLPLAGRPMGDDPLAAAVEPTEGASRASSRLLQDPPRQSSRGDAVLAQALDVQFNGISLASTSQLLGGDDLLRKLEELRRQLNGLVDERHAMLAGGLALTGSLSIGYIVWLVRGGVLVTSMLSALPAWQMIDPLPVLAAAGAGKRRSDDDDDAANDDPDVERLFEHGGAGAEPAATPPDVTPGKVPTDTDRRATETAP